MKAVEMSLEEDKSGEMPQPKDSYITKTWFQMLPSDAFH